MPEPPPDGARAGAPEEVVALAEARQTARASRDYAEADRLRDQLTALGWLVTDAPGGYRLSPLPPYDVHADVRALPDNSTEADTHRVTVSVLVDGWPDDTATCLDALLAHTRDDVVIQALDLGNVDGAGDVLHSRVDAATAAGRRLTAWHLAGAAGWAEARTALLRADTAAVHVWCELSTVLTGDAITPLVDAILADEADVGSGWKGVDVDVADGWRSFTPAGPGAVDALLGYLFAMRRSAALAAGGPHPKARFYRNADMEFSFALRAAARDAGGIGRLVVPAADLPCRQDRHRGYHDSDPAYRDRESARTYARFLQRFRGRGDLLARNEPAAG